MYDRRQPEIGFKVLQSTRLGLHQNAKETNEPRGDQRNSINSTVESGERVCIFLIISRFTHTEITFIVGGEEGMDLNMKSCKGRTQIEVVQSCRVKLFYFFLFDK